MLLLHTKKGDANGDDTVNSSDVLVLNSFLKGKAGSNGATAERLDVNLDGVIDANDVTLLKNINLGLVSSSTVTSTNTTALTSQESRKYYKYNAQKGTYTSSYTLSPVSNISTSSTVSTRSIIGNDNREIDNSLIGVVRFHYKDENYGFTGFVIDDHTILTAAHCLSPTSIGATPASSYDIRFYNEDGTAISSITATPVEYHIPYQYILKHSSADESDYSVEYYDYALVTVKEDLSDYICFNLGVARNNIKTSNPSTYVTGFSNTVYSKAELRGKKSTAVGTIQTLANYNIYYNTDTTGGDSGAPVYLIKDGVKTVIGIHTYGVDDHSNFNHCTRITTDILHFVYNNNNLSY